VSKADEMLTFVPSFVSRAKTYSEIINSEGTELDNLETNTNDVLSQFFVETATWGLDLWEQMLNIQSYVGKPYDQRRSAIISKLRGMGTVTVDLIKNVAESYAYGTVEVTEHPELYSFTIKFIDSRGTPSNLDDLKEAIKEIKPAHLGVVYEFTYTTWGEVKNITWGDVAIDTWEALKTRII